MILETFRSDPDYDYDYEYERSRTNVRASEPCESQCEPCESQCEPCESQCEPCELGVVRGASHTASHAIHASQGASNASHRFNVKNNKIMDIII